MTKNINNKTSAGNCWQDKRITSLVVVLTFVSVFGTTGCKKFIQVPPPAGTITENTVYTSDATAISVMTALYGAMNNTPFQGSGGISVYAGLSADELILNGSITDLRLLGYYKNALSQINPSTAAGGEHWASFYSFVFKCNAAIEGLNASSTLTPLVKQRLLGEAYFMRAFFYFYLVNEFGDVPLALTTDPKINAAMVRSPKASVYDQIIKDLLFAEQNLSDNYQDATLLATSNERVRPVKWAATALLARVYLYTNQWAKAEEKASAVITNSTLYQLLSNLNDVFLKNSSEAIWQLQPTALGKNTIDGQMFVIPANGPSTGASTANPVYLSKSWLMNFETNDHRAIFGNWVDTTIYKISNNPVVWDTIAYPNKYKINVSQGVNTINGLTEYFMVLRLAEQYLIRAEARAQQGNIAGAQSDLNTIRHRAGLGDTPANDQASLLTAILHERQVELFSEWGHRWFDLKRTGKIDQVMSVATPLKSAGTVNWQSYQQLYPIPLTELQAAPNLRQNPGY